MADRLGGSGSPNLRFHRDYHHECAPTGPGPAEANDRRFGFALVLKEQLGHVGANPGESTFHFRLEATVGLPSSDDEEALPVPERQ